jgi:hypothetical protein
MDEKIRPICKLPASVADETVTEPLRILTVKQ